MKKIDPEGIETNFEVRSFDAKISLEEYNKLPKSPIYIILDNLRSAFNVGSIFRICDTIRAKGLFLCGYTACPPNKKLLKTSLGTVEFVPWKKFEKTTDAIMFLKQKGIQVWAAETTSISKPYYSVEYPDEIGIVFGNEALGVSKEAMEICDQIIEIPLYGYKNSLNVAVSCSVICFKILETFKQKKLLFKL